MFAVHNKESANVLEDLRAWKPHFPWPESLQLVSIEELHGWSREDFKEILAPVIGINLFNLLHPRDGM